MPGPLTEALSRLQGVRGGVEDVLDASAGLPASKERLAGLLRGLGADVGALQALWSAVQGALEAAEQGSGAAAAAATDGGEKTEDREHNTAARERRSPPAVEALAEAVAAALPKLEAPSKRPRLLGK